MPNACGSRLLYGAISKPAGRARHSSWLRNANGMLLSVYELLRSRQDQINAARDYIGALRDYWIARSDLEKALAGPLPPAATATFMKAAPPQASSNAGS